MATKQNDNGNKGPLEKDIQREICEYLQRNRYFFWRNNNKPIFDVTGRKFRAMPRFTPKGLPDIIVIYKGLFIALEVKRPKAKLRPEQADFGLHCNSNGGRYFRVTSVMDLYKIKELETK